MTIAQLASPGDPVSVVSGRIWDFSSSRKPRVKHGEKQFSRWLHQRGEFHRYEPWVYPLRSGFSMRPDFWLPATDTHPEFHFEITFLDAALLRLNRELAQVSDRSAASRRLQAQLQRNQREMARRWTYKQRKVAEVREQYRLDVVLIPYALWKSIKDHPDLLDELIPTAALSQTGPLAAFSA